MTSREEYLVGCVEKHRQQIYNVEKYIWLHPETGYREWNTSNYLAEQFVALGYQPVFAGDIPGFYTDIDTGNPGPKILIMAEMDALLCGEDQETLNGTLHACGHNAQCAGLVGLAAALKEKNTIDGLCGSIRLMAVPAEELIELSFRETLRQKGIIHFYSGKAEFLRRGYMDHADIAILIHTRNLGDDVDFFARRGSNGFITKEVIYYGKAAHAASSPEEGINALYAATMGLQAVNSLRETFREDRKIRVHGIITNGGSAPNVIPDKARIEMQIRGASLEIIKSVEKVVDRALIGAAISMGTEIEIKNSPGYTPFKNDKALMGVFEKCAHTLCGSDKVNIDYNNWSTGSTDMGDLCEIIPVIQPYAAGASGNAHSSSYKISEPERACVNSAKVELLMINMLLQNDAVCAKEIIDGFVPTFTKDSYTDYLKSCFITSSPVSYTQTGIIVNNPDNGEIVNHV